MGVVLSVSHLVIDAPPGGSVLAIVGGACVATAAVLLLRLFGHAQGAVRWQDQRGQPRQHFIDGIER
ncbi:MULTISPECIES: hypothetical protein [unclassified Mycolicibacterium]|uniref:hypothetical protein n=1 Tax=unclassified Mycolicibacterium TaxID=2636767 RepID=UPI002ED8D97C